MIQTSFGIEMPSAAPPPATSPELWAAARQFEALLLQMVMKSMRETVEETDLFGQGPELGLYRQMHDEALAGQASGAIDLGLARSIVRQLSGQAEPARSTLEAVAAAREAMGRARVQKALQRPQTLGWVGQERRK